MKPEATQLETIKSLAKECQTIVARHDDLLFKIKALTATVWSAVSGWGVHEATPNLLLVALFAVLGLWFVAATFRGAQKRYIKMSDILFRFLMDAERLTELETNRLLPTELPRSLGGNETIVGKTRLVLRGFCSPTVSAFYGFFSLMSLVLYVVVTR